MMSDERSGFKDPPWDKGRAGGPEKGPLRGPEGFTLRSEGGVRIHPTKGKMTRMSPPISERWNDAPAEGRTRV